MKMSRRGFLRGGLAAMLVPLLPITQQEERGELVTECTRVITGEATPGATWGYPTLVWRFDFEVDKWYIERFNKATWNSAQLESYDPETEEPYMG